MKTLNDVIDAMERCSIPHYFDCKGCPYEDDDAETGCRPEDRDADVLHYLKVLQKMQRAQPVTKGECDELYNNPLTWQEIQQMEGKPVWVERPEWKEWLLISEIDGDKCEIYFRDKWGNGVIANARNVGYWRAYRKERK